MLLLWRPRVLLVGAALLFLTSSWIGVAVSAALTALALAAEIAEHGRSRPLVLAAAAVLVALLAATVVHEAAFPWTTVQVTVGPTR